MAVPFLVVFLADHPRPTRRQGSGGGPPPQDLRTAGQPLLVPSKMFDFSLGHGPGGSIGRRTRRRGAVRPFGVARAGLVLVWARDAVNSGAAVGPYASPGPSRHRVERHRRRPQVHGSVSSEPPRVQTLLANSSCVTSSVPCGVCHWAGGARWLEVDDVVASERFHPDSRRDGARCSGG